MMNMNALSVIIPVYNSRDHIEECVASITAVNKYCDTVRICEIILVDDGSEDGSSELCDRIAGSYATDICTVRVIHQSNSGVSAARNRGIREAVGSFILFVDSDDTVDAKSLAGLMKKVSYEASADMAVFGLSFDYYSGDKIYRSDVMVPMIEGERTREECSEALFELYKCNMMSPLWNKLIKRSILEDAALLLREDMFLYEDLEFSLRALAECKTVYFCREPIYHYRQAGDGSNAGRRLKHVAHIPEITDKVEEALAPFGRGDDILSALYLVLAREKIGVSSKRETEVICDDFREWTDAHGYADRIRNDEYGMMLYRKQTLKLLFKRRITRVRHSIATMLKKKIGDFRKWSFL